MTISIITPTLNEQERIAEHIKYLKKHATNAVAEIIVVDGGSEDATVEKARHAGATVIEHGKASRAIQMNAGARASKGDILYFVHADTRPPKSYASDILKSVNQGHEIGNFRVHYERPNLGLLINTFFTRFKWLGCQGGDKTLYVLRQTFEKLGGYNEEYVIMEEYDILKRLGDMDKFQVMPNYVYVSTRKYRKFSYLQITYANMIAYNMFKRGAEPEAIKEKYAQLLS